MEKQWIPFLSNISARVSEDGQAIALSFVTKNEQRFDCGLAATDGHSFLAAIISSLQQAAKKQPASAEGGAPTSAALPVQPIEVHGHTLEDSADGTQVLIALDVGPFKLVFASPKGNPD